MSTSRSASLYRDALDSDPLEDERDRLMTARLDAGEDAEQVLADRLAEIEARFERMKAAIRNDRKRMRRRLEANDRRLLLSLARGQSRAVIARVQATRPTCEGRHRRAPGMKPVKRRGSRRTTAPTRGSPDDDLPPEPDLAAASRLSDRRAARLTSEGVKEPAS